MNLNYIHTFIVCKQKTKKNASLKKNTVAVLQAKLHSAHHNAARIGIHSGAYGCAGRP
jgi:hypothetical protein